MVIWSMLSGSTMSRRSAVLRVHLDLQLHGTMIEGGIGRGGDGSVGPGPPGCGAGWGKGEGEGCVGPGAGFGSPI
jgi:hypothetical protein